MQQLIILFYLLINSFFAGWLFGGHSKWYNIILALLFGVFAIIYAVIAAVLSLAWNAINKYFQLEFWWQYHFTYKWNNLKAHDIKKLNDQCKKNHHSNTVRDKIYRYCIKCVNEINNYEVPRN